MAVVTMGTNAEPVQQGQHDPAVMGGDAGWFRNSTFHCSSESGKQVRRFSETVLLTGIFTGGPLRLINSKEG